LKIWEKIVAIAPIVAVITPIIATRTPGFSRTPLPGVGETTPVIAGSGDVVIEGDVTWTGGSPTGLSVPNNFVSFPSGI